MKTQNVTDFEKSSTIFAANVGSRYHWFIHVHTKKKNKMIFLYAVNPYLTVWNYGILPKHPDQVVHQLLEVHQCQGQLTPGLPHHLLHSCGTWPPPPVSHAGIHPGRESPGGGFCWCALWSWKYFNKDSYTSVKSTTYSAKFSCFLINYRIHRKRKKMCTKKDEYKHAIHQKQGLFLCMFIYCSCILYPPNWNRILSKLKNNLQMENFVTFPHGNFVSLFPKKAS